MTTRSNPGTPRSSNEAVRLPQSGVPDAVGRGSATRAMRRDDAPPTPSGSSFYAAMRVLPKEQRHAMFAIYGFCRAVDDVADGPGERSARIAALAQWRAHVDLLYEGMPPARVAPLAGPVRAYGLRREDFLAIIDGVEMDALADIVAPDLATLDLYCDRVASAVGRLSVRVFGLRGDDASALAYHLGRALQLTNILRDLDEDAANGRLYLPRETLREAGIVEAVIGAILAHPALGRACMTLAGRARDHFVIADRIMARHPLRIVRAPVLMSRVYQAILERVLARGFEPPRVRVRTRRRTLLWTAVRFGLVRTP